MTSASPTDGGQWHLMINMMMVEMVMSILVKGS